MPVTESTPLKNPFWQYSRDKIACEDRLMVAYREADFTITGDSAPTWNQVYQWLGRAAGVEEPRLVHVASETIAAAVPELGPGLVGDKTHSMLFDTSKLQALVPDFRTTIPYSLGAERTIAWYDAHEEAQQVDRDLDARFDELVARA